MHAGAHLSSRTVAMTFLENFQCTKAYGRREEDSERHAPMEPHRSRPPPTRQLVLCIFAIYSFMHPPPSHLPPSLPPSHYGRRTRQ